MKSKWRKITSNQRFGRLVVIKQERGESINNTMSWLCLCDCGKETHVSTSNLNSGNTKSCGCLKQETIHPDLTGKNFGKLTVISPAGKRDKYSMWKCSCDCGGSIYSRTNDLRSGRAKSCGCLRSGILKNGISLPPNEAMKNIVIRMYSDNAKKSGLEFSLSKEHLAELFAGNCHYCGDPPSRTRKRLNRPGSFTYNGIDRKDNTKGYVEGNVLSCCRICNLKKGAMPYEDFIAWVQKVNKNLV
ncbi:MAG: hypothetical protein M0R32_09040 [Candidatus Cloacimonetes bacterium]|jgi:hypothetical protein|nr:hypothetical protein [Candidatus Cloacimonadota bacterium]